jgi:CHAT domain-containing protein
MRCFYENLWQKKMGKLEALRQAQLSILNDENLGSHVRGPGAGRVPRLDASESPRADARLWAAWMLSGDPGPVSVSLPNNPLNQ